MNAFLIQSHNGWVLIDTGYPGTIELLRSSLDRLGLKIPDIQHIVLTHLHPDHTGELAQIKAISQ
ncbi:MAG: MBL fold metallo-hydrolase, partial [Cyanobacteria bacterium J06649_11]